MPVQEIQAKLPWDTLGAIPEMLQTAYGSLFRALQLQSSDRLLIRGATTSVGLAATAMAKNHGSFVAGACRAWLGVEGSGFRGFVLSARSCGAAAWTCVRSSVGGLGFWPCVPVRPGCHRHGQEPRQLHCRRVTGLAILQSPGIVCTLVCTLQCWS